MKGIGKSKVLVMALLGLSAFSPMAAVVAGSGKPAAVAAAETTRASHARSAENSRTPREPETYGFGVDVLGSWRAEEKMLAAERQKVRSYVEQVAGYEGRSLDGAQYTYNDLYYDNNERAGYVVDFSTDGKDGYAIFFVIDGEPTLAEINLDARSPYSGRAGKYLYPSFGTYAVKDDNGVINQIVDLSTMSIGSNIEGGDKDPEYVNYVYHKGEKSVTDIEVMECYMNYGCGGRFSPKDLTNYCANVAGVIALNYWNRRYYNALLKLDFSKGEYDNNRYNLHDMSDEVAERYIRLFYKYMHTNRIGNKYGGTLPQDLYDGFERLIKETGRFTAKRTYVKNFDEIKEQIDNGVPVFMVSTDYYFTSYPLLPNIKYDDENILKFICTHRWGLKRAHSFVGYGYATYKLYDKNGEETVIELVKIADGWGGLQYFNLNESILYSAAAIEVVEIPKC